VTKLTSEPGVLRVASAFPDPPFELAAGGERTGFDAELMRSICDDLGLTLRPVPYTGELAVIEQIPTREKLGIAFARASTALCQAVDESLEGIKKSGKFEALRSRWFDESRES
jgi:ABC-type amino acid transport substrate-binding protein